MVKAVRYLFLLVLVCLMSLPSLQAVENKGTYRILVFHAAVSSQKEIQIFNDAFRRRLNSQGFNIAIKDVRVKFNPDTLSAKDAKETYDIIDRFKIWSPNIILANDDKSLMELMNCNHHLLRRTPIVFSGVLYPNWDEINKHPHITGIWNRPDYRMNIDLIERLFGKTNILFFYDNSTIEKQMYKELLSDAQKNNILFSNSDAKSSTKEELKLSTNNTKRTTLYAINLPNLTAVNFLEFNSKIFKVGLQLNNTPNNSIINNNTKIPVFTITSSGFNSGNKIIGGYFTPLTMRAERVASIVEHILEGTPEHNIPIVEAPKMYCFDWNVLKEFNIDEEQLPQNSIIYNKPRQFSHPTGFIIIVSIIILLMTYIIFNLIYVFHQERNRKRNAQTGLKERNNVLQLALSGGEVYAWRMENNLFAIENSPYSKRKSDYQVLTMEELLEIVHPDDKELLKDNIDDIYNRKKDNAIFQCRFKFSTSNFTWWEVRCTPGNTDPRDANYIVGLLVDIQSFKEKEQQLIELQEKAEESNKMKSIFLANMSHEIRTPLNAIVGFSNLIADEDLSTDDKKMFKNTINKNTNLLLNLVNDILEFSRIESGKMTFNMEHCELSMLLEDIYQTHKLLIPESIEFIKEFSPLSIIIYVDRNRFTELISNLINNAIKFTKKGFIKLSSHYDEQNNRISIQLQDTGIGMSEEQCNNVFERFYKGNEFAQGTGLGLAICQNIATKMNGKISVTSKPGIGSCFSVNFPCTIVNTIL